MMEKIISIIEVEENRMGGYAIGTDKQVVKLLIGNHQDCCESWGYFMSEDELEHFIGADLFDINLMDTALNHQKIKEVYEGGIMFVDLSTSKGLLQFVAYNEHNGYYGHEAKVISEQLKHEESL